MKFKLTLIIFLVFSLNNIAYSKDDNCNELKKLSLSYIKCKGKNFVDETKEYQKKEWSKEKEKIDKLKKKVLK